MRINIKEVNRVFQIYLRMYPIRNPFVVVERDRDGHDVLLYKKDLGRFEKWLQKKVGGPEVIRRPLDEMGTEIWRLCNGKNTGLQVCKKMDKKFKVKIEPVVPRVVGFLRTLENRNLIIVVESLDKLKELGFVKDEG